MLFISNSYLNRHERYIIDNILLGHHSTQMARPVHIITNDPHFAISLQNAGINDYLKTEDSTQQEGQHWHYHYHWPQHSPHTLKPTRKTLIRRARNISGDIKGCPTCIKNTSDFNHQCKICKTYYKIIWIKDPQHHIHTHNYLRRKPLFEKSDRNNTHNYIDL